MARSCRSFGLVACLLVGLSIWPVWAQQSDDFTNGVRLYDQGEYDDAVKALETATKANPRLEAAWYYIGLAKYKQGDYPGALAALEQSTNLVPSRPGTRLVVGQIYETQAAYEQAVNVYQDELRYRRGKDVLPVLNAMGRALYLGGRPADAIVPLQKVVSEQPNYVESVYYLGLCEHLRGNHEGALKLFRAALVTMEEWRDNARRLARLKEQLDSGEFTSEQQRDFGLTSEKLAQEYGYAQDFGTNLQKWPALNKSLGDTYLAMKEWASARNAYRKALDRDQWGDPADPDAYTRVARAYLYDARALFQDDGMLFQAAGVLQDAIASAKTAQDKNANFAPGHNIMGEIYAFQANTYVTRADLGIASHTCEEALVEFQAALKSDPNYVVALANAADCLLLLERTAEARDVMTKALSLEPKRDDLHAQMAEVLLAQEDPEGALGEAQTAMMINKKNVRALNAAGRVYMYYRNDLGEAIQHYAEAATADPKRWDTFANLGLAFFQMESWVRARHEFKTALDLIPTATIANTAQQQAYLYYLIARTYHQTKMYDQEVTALNEALGLFPSHLDTLRQLAWAYESQKKYRAAERVLQDALQLSGSPQDDADVNTQLGAMLEKEGRVHEAVAAYSAALQADPNSLPAQQALERLQTR